MVATPNTFQIGTPGVAPVAAPATAPVFEKEAFGTDVYTPPSVTHANIFPNTIVGATVVQMNDGPTLVRELTAHNPASVEQFLQIKLDASTVPFTPGTTAPDYIFRIPAASRINDILQNVAVGGTGFKMIMTTTRTGATALATTNLGSVEGVYEG